jgi:uncharacterized delta-60 repeat protein
MRGFRTKIRSRPEADRGSLAYGRRMRDRGVRRRLHLACATTLAALLLASSAVAAPSGAPVRFWEVDKVERGGGEKFVTGGGQIGDVLHKVIDLGPTAFNFGPSLADPTPRYSSPVDGRASGDVFSSADGARYSVAAQAPVLNPFRANSPKGGVTHLDEYHAYEKRAGDASLKITITEALMEAVDDNLGLSESECPRRAVRCFPVRSIVRFHARAYAESAGGDFYDVGGVAFVKGHTGNWDHWVATSSDSQKPPWTNDDFFNVIECGDLACHVAAGDVQYLHTKRTLKVPLASVREGELFAVHVSLEAETVDDRGRESSALAFIRDPQERGPALLAAHGLTPRGKPKFKEPASASPKPARCPGGAARKAGVLGLSAPQFTASESDGDPLVLVTRTGGSRGSASVTLRARGGTARAGADFRRTEKTVRFADGDATPRLVEIPLREDGQAEPAEAFTVALDHGRCAKLGVDRHAAVTILDDDAPPAPAPGAPAPPPRTPQPAPTPAPAPAGLDHTFGVDGRVSTAVGDGRGEAVVIQPDGGIVTAGSRGTSSGRDFALTRHDQSGNLDRSFGTDGVAATDLGGAGDEAYDAALLPDGGIIAVGRTDAAGFTKLDFGVARYRPGGTPDPGFSGGFVRTDILGGGDQANAVAVQPDGRIVVGGFAAAGASSDFALVRYNPDGTLDPSFGGDGIVTTDLGTPSDDIRALAIQPDGSIVAAGTADEDVALARYLPDGRLDPGFGQGGTKITDFGSDDVATGVALTARGEILIAGYTLGPRVNRDFALARFTSAGALDAAFGDHGIVKTDVGGGDDFAENLVVDAQGRIVVVGRATSPTILDMALVRYEPGGTPDTSFDGDGILTADFHGKGDFGQDVALDSAGRIVAAGYAGSTAGTDLALMRALP